MMNMMEDFVVPVRGGQSGTEIDTLAGLDFNAIDDIEYLRLKILGSLKIPKAFLGFDENAGDKSTLSSQDVRFARTIERIQRIMESELTKIAIIHLFSQGISENKLNNFKLELTRSSQMAELERLETLDQKINVANSLKDLRMYSDKWIYTNVFNMNEDDIEDERSNLIEDFKYAYRLEQIESDGKDPADESSKDNKDLDNLDDEYENKIKNYQSTFITDNKIKRFERTIKNMNKHLKINTNNLLNS